MTETHEFAQRLKQIPAKIEAWRAQARHLQALAQAAEISNAVSADFLQSVEETAGDIYREIETFDALVAEITKTSPEAASQLAEVGDSLHLVLLEITELSTKMYSVSSSDAPGEVPPSAKA